MEYHYSVALIVATDPEESAIRNMYAEWTPVEVSGDRQAYYEASFQKDGKTCRVIYARQGQMGMTAAASLSMKMICNFRPRYLMMVGVAAGISLHELDEQIYGDVIVADVIWNYAAGKFVPLEEGTIKCGNLGFKPRPYAIMMDQKVRPYVEAAIRSPENQNHVHIGPMASGSSVVANAEILNKQIRTLYRDTAGLDMEAFAVAYAAQDATEPRPTALIVKSVCDYTNPEKTEQYQKFAAYTGAEFAKLLYENYLPMENLQ